MPYVLTYGNANDPNYNGPDFDVYVFSRPDGFFTAKAQHQNAYILAHHNEKHCWRVIAADPNSAAAAAIVAATGLANANIPPVAPVADVGGVANDGQLAN